MKSICLFLLLTLSVTSALQATDDKELNAFKQSYSLETKSEFTKAIAVMKEVYREDSYEINVRLGYLCYEAGQFTQSMTYYQNSISLKP